MLVIELNEFNPNYVRAEALKLNLNNILFFLNLKHVKTFTRDKVEHHGLDPWVQWVSIHSGVPFKDHKIARLGQTKIQTKKQIWNKITTNSSKRCGVWGVMNAPRGSKKGLDFFVPDPWSYEEKAYPKLLDDFLSLPRYMAKNYLSPKLFKLLSKTKKTLSFILKNMSNGDSRKIIKHFIKASIYTGLNIHSLTTLLDYINCLLFIKYRKKHNSDFSLIFLNHLAHLQHHFWNKNGKISNQMKFGLKTCDVILGELKKNLRPNESIILLNGLNQKNVQNMGNFIYRQKDPERFIKNICPIKCEVKQNMTNDGTLIFKNVYDAYKAKKILAKINLVKSKQKLLYLEELSPKKIFYQIDIYQKIDKDEQIKSSEEILNFYDNIELIAERTGSHIPDGDIFFRNIEFPSKVENHKIFDVVEKYYAKKC